MPVTSRGGVTVVMELTPSGWMRWIDQPSDAVRDQMLPLDRFRSAERTDDPIARLRASDRGGEIQAILDRFLLPYLGGGTSGRACACPPGPDAGIARAAVGAMAAPVGVSASALLRQANCQLGFSPCTLVRRTRFRRATTTLLMSTGAPDHGTVSAGYHDVPRFLRDAEAFFRLTPRRFLALPMPYLRARTDVVDALLLN